ncbi:unnamed protein product [Lampetra fluviatilis]
MPMPMPPLLPAGACARRDARASRAVSRRRLSIALAGDDAALEATSGCTLARADCIGGGRALLNIERSVARR